MARFLDNPDFVEKCREANRKVDLKVWIDWFGDGQLDEVGEADNEIIKFNLSRELEGDLGQAILDQGTLVLDNSNNQYSPKSIASRFNVDMGSYYEFNLIPNRDVLIDISVNGSDYVQYYRGIITNIEPNYDNSRVSITLEDPMLALENFEAPDKLYIEENAREVIRDLLYPTPVDFKEELIDDIEYELTYNFRDEGSIFNALRLISEMVWGKFYVEDDNLIFINFKELDQTTEPIIETIEDSQFIENNYNEIFSSEDLYTRVELNSNPLRYTTDESELQMVWTGSEKQSRVNEEYIGSDIEGNQLQLTHTVEGTVEEPTNNVPIAENSLTVSFADKTYYTDSDMSSGIESVDWSTGLITFKNNDEFPLPNNNQLVNISYNYFILTIPPRNSNGEPYEKSIIAELDNPATNIQDIGNYIKFQAVDLDYDVEYAAYKEDFDTLQHSDGGGSGIVRVWGEEKTLSSNANTIRISGQFWIDSADYKYPWDRGTKCRDATVSLDLFINGELKGRVGQFTGTHRATDRFEKKFPVSPGDTAQLRLNFKRSGEKRNKAIARGIEANIGEKIVDEVTNEVRNVRAFVELLNPGKFTKYKITFENDSDSQVAVYSEYEGKKVGNIYLLGRPLERTNHINVTEENADANESFAYMGKTLTIQNDLFLGEERVKETADFLLSHYSTPRSVVNTTIRGLGHIDLMDKITLNREEADIDNEFFIRAIDEEFTEEGEWNQTLELFQASESVWNYSPDGINTIVSNPSGQDTTPSERPAPVTNLTLELENIEAGSSGYPVIRASYDGNKDTSHYNIYLRRGTQGSWEFIDRTSEENFIIESVYGRAEYFVRVVGENPDGILTDFSDATVESIQYFGADLLLPEDIDLREVVREVQKGSYVSFIEVRINSVLGDYVEEFEIYYKHEDDTDWTLDGRTDRLFYEILASRLGFYEVKVIAKDIRGNKADFNDVDSLVIEVEGKTDKPSSVPFEKIYWGADYIEMVWEPHPDSDFSRYEIRMDDSFGEDN